MKAKAVFLANPDNLQLSRVYDSMARKWIEEQLDLLPEIVYKENLEQMAAALRDVEVAFSTWGIPRFSEEQLANYFPKLKVVLYGAGSVQLFARPFLARGITVVSAWAANAIPVAEYTLAQIVLANKGFFRAARQYKEQYGESRDNRVVYPGNYRAKVGLLGAGMIGRNVIERLRSIEAAVFVFDPFLSEESAAELGVTKLELTELFATCDTISNHLANLPATVGILNREHFDRMLPHATFINTGRGAQVVEDDLIRALKEVPTRTALLDVTYPEPVREDSELLKMDNVILTPHIAGSISNEVARMGMYMVEECGRYLRGERMLYQVSMEMLETMA